MRYALALAILGSVPATLAAQDVQIVRESTIEAEISIDVIGRASFADGVIVDDPFAGDLLFSDIFDPGVGLGIEGNLLYNLHPDWQAGGYVSFGVDWYNGVRAFDEFGNSLEPETLTVETGFVGLKAVDRLWPFWWSGQVGLGFAHYESVDATEVVGGVARRGELLGSATRVAFELTGRAGFGERGVAGFLGIGFRVQGGPDRGADAAPEVDPDVLVAFLLELGLDLRF
jgi:hypothetical protein